jgi:hypothetical protein
VDVPIAEIAPAPKVSGLCRDWTLPLSATETLSAPIPRAAPTRSIDELRRSLIQRPHRLVFSLVVDFHHAVFGGVPDFAHNNNREEAKP